MCLKRKESSVKMPGRIIDVNDTQITIRFIDTTKYKKGQFVIVGIPKQRTTALGKTISISDIIACGEIANVDHDTIIINSAKSSPIIARLTIKDNCKKKCNMVVDRIA